LDQAGIFVRYGKGERSEVGLHVRKIGAAATASAAVVRKNSINERQPAERKSVRRSNFAIEGCYTCSASASIFCDSPQVLCH